MALSSKGLCLNGNYKQFDLFVSLFALRGAVCSYSTPPIFNIILCF